MSDFAQQSLSWQFSQWQRQIGEWWDWQTRQLNGPDETDVAQWLMSPPWQLLRQLIFWGGLIALGLWSLWVVGRGLAPYVKSWRTRNQRDRTTAPSSLQHTAAQWQTEAKQQYLKGHYRQACLCLYLGMLQILHDRHIAPHLPSRTDGEYRQLIQTLPRPDPYFTLLVMHQGLKFGDTRPTAALFDRCWHAYSDLSTHS
ncbi:DUF4129 domain-containing protein [Spirulina major]|uniref:DUF4129 domain-containing protein n=1 Tax=Spirulina major TaxID=270636 RepID=UPI0009349561|nr:DUF4129 domain-containing protein [Spirulina major]